MGFRFRKSINCGAFRINLSKSGIGYSYGCKGFRKTRKASGGSRTTFSMPGTGISYVHDSKKKYTRNKTNVAFNNFELANDCDNIDSTVVKSSKNEFVERLNRANKKRKFLKLIRIGCLLLSIISFFNIVNSNIWGYIMLLGLILFFIIPKSTYMELDFDFTEDCKKYYTDLLYSIHELKKIEKLSEITSTETYQDLRNHGGAGMSVFQKEIKLSNQNTFISDFDIPVMFIQKKEIIFLPNTVAVFQKGEWVAVDWKDVNLDYADTTFIDSIAPNDTEILGYTYLHKNNDGSPDRRYSVNPQLVQCAYAEIQIESNNGLLLIIHSSNRKLAFNFYKALNEMKNFYN